MLTRSEYPNTFYSPTYPLAKNNTAKPQVTFAGGLGHEPDVFDVSLTNQSKAAPKSCTRLDLQA